MMRQIRKARLLCLFGAWLMLWGVLFVVFPNVAGAQFTGPLVPCGTDTTLPCQACHVIILAQNIINFLIYLATFIAVMMFVYAGFLYVTSAGSTEKVSKAHKIFWTVFIGLLITLTAWLVVDTVMKTFVDERKFGPWNQISDEQCLTERLPPEDTADDIGGITVPDQPTPPPGPATCPDCVTIDSELPLKAGAGDQIHPDLQTKLLDFQDRYSGSWQVTEGYPPTVQHKNSCHSTGTCVDANFVGNSNPTGSDVRAFVQAAYESRLRAQYEVSSSQEAFELRNSGARADDILVVPGITAPHFSVYHF